MTTKPKTLIQSKAFWINIVTALAGVGGYVADQVNAKAAIGAIIIGAVGILLRGFSEPKISGIFTGKK